MIGGGQSIYIKPPFKSYLRNILFTEEHSWCPAVQSKSFCSPGDILPSFVDGSRISTLLSQNNYSHRCLHHMLIACALTYNSNSFYSGSQAFSPCYCLRCNALRCILYSVKVHIQNCIQIIWIRLSIHHSNLINSWHSFHVSPQ